MGQTNEHIAAAAPPAGWSALAESLHEWLGGITNVQLYWWMAWQSIRQRYAGSVIGPFWVSISMGAFILAIGVVFGEIMGLRRDVFVPYLASGVIVWSSIAGIAGESCRLLYGNRHILLSLRLPFSVLPMQLLTNHLIIFAHNIVVYGVVTVVYDVPVTAGGLLMALAGLVLLMINAFWLVIVVALVCCRYRDFSEVVTIVLQFGFYLTPIVWHPSKLSITEHLVVLNPFAHFLAVVREPLLGGAPTALNWIVVIGSAIGGLAFALAFYTRFRTRYIYWV